MAYQAFDTADVLTGHAHELVAQGFKDAFVYCRDDRAPDAEIQGLLSVGMRIGAVQEQGQATGPAYFTVPQASLDVERAIQWAKETAWPVTVPIFKAIDYDAAWADIKDHWGVWHGGLKAAGWHTGAYGSWTICKSVLDAGLGMCSWLAYATGWGNQGDYRLGLRAADVVQGPGGTISVSGASFGVDLDTVRNPAVLRAA